MKIDEQIKYWAQLINESLYRDDYLMEQDTNSIFRQDEKGNIDCGSNELTSLEGAPQEVRGNFYCEYNKNLTNKQILEYKKFLKNQKPEQIVNGHFHSLL